MTEHQRETAFLRRIILFDDTDERRKLEERIAQAERDERCLLRVGAAIGVVIVLGALFFSYGILLHENFLYGNPDFVTKLICELGLALLISLVIIAGLLMFHRQKLNRVREECRQLVIKLLEAHPELIPASRSSGLGTLRQAVPRLAAGIVETTPG